jgi:outer membrane protein TolC
MPTRLPLRGLLAGIALLLPLAALPAAEPPPDLAGGIALPTLVRLALQRNPGVQAARAEWRAALAQYPQATALPDPMIGFEYRGANAETNAEMQEWEGMVEQAFPFPGTLAAAGDVALAQASQARSRYEQTVRDLIVDLQLSYHELAYLQRAAALTRAHQELLRQLETQVAARYGRQQAQLADLLKAQSQSAQLGYDLVLLEELRRTEVVRLLARLDLPSDTALGPARDVPLPPLTASLPELEALALERRQELQAARQMVDEAGAMRALARRENLPMFALQAKRMEEEPSAMGTGDADPWTFGITMTIPLWRGKNRARLAQAEDREEAARLRAAELANQTRADLHAAWFRLTNAQRLVTLYEQTLLPQAEQAMALAEARARATPADFAGLLETQGVVLNFQLARLRAVADCQQARARLERLLGGPLPAPTPAEATP